MCTVQKILSDPEVIKLFLRLISAEHKIQSAHKYRNNPNTLYIEIEGLELQSL